MDRHSYEEFTKRLIRNLESDEDVLGLIAVGSMAAEQGHMPDEWSDHDFFVIVRSGKQDRYRSGYGWLPDAQEIVWAFQETIHGVKILYKNCHLLEFAIFDEKEIELAKINSYRILLDRANLLEIVSRIKERTKTGSAEQNDRFHASLFLFNLLVGFWRYQRGEVLSAARFVKASALNHLMLLLHRHVPSNALNLADNIDPTRRFELVYPDLGQELGEAMLCQIPKAVWRMITVFERELDIEKIGIPHDALVIIKKALQESSSN